MFIVLFVFLGLDVNNGQLLPDIYVIFVLCLNQLKCPINTRLLPHVEAPVINSHEWMKRGERLEEENATTGPQEGAALPL